jgi:hypothetical protein
MAKKQLVLQSTFENLNVKIKQQDNVQEIGETYKVKQSVTSVESIGDTYVVKNKLAIDSIGDPIEKFKGAKDFQMAFED